MTGQRSPGRLSGRVSRRTEKGEEVATWEDKEVFGLGKLEREKVWLRVHIISQLTPMFLTSFPPLEFPLAASGHLGLDQARVVAREGRKDDTLWSPQSPALRAPAPHMAAAELPLATFCSSVSPAPACPSAVSVSRSQMEHMPLQATGFTTRSLCFPSSLTLGHLHTFFLTLSPAQVAFLSLPFSLSLSFPIFLSFLFFLLPYTPLLTHTHKCTPRTSSQASISCIYAIPFPYNELVQPAALRATGGPGRL